MSPAPGASRTFRVGTPADARRVARLHALSQRVTYGPDLPAGAVGDIDEESIYQTWRARLAVREHRVVLLADSQEGELAGFGMISSLTAPWSSVNSLHVRPDLQGVGLGRALITALVEVAEAWRRPDVQLHVLATNVTARRFYEHLGWQQRGTAPHHSIAEHRVEIVRYELRCNSGASNAMRGPGVTDE